MTYKATNSAVLALALATHLFGAERAASQSDGPRFSELQPGIELALRPREGRFDDGNSGLIRGASFAILVDAPTDETVIQHWIEELLQLPETTQLWLVNTHWHADHVQGNAALINSVERLRVIGHESLADDIPGRAASAHDERVERLQEQIPAALAALKKGESLSGRALNEDEQIAQEEAIAGARDWLDQNIDVEFVAPSRTYRGLFHVRNQTELESQAEAAKQRDSAENTGSGPPVPIAAVELHHFEAHTRGDTVVLIPGRRVAFTGDLLDELPFVGHGSPRSWIEALGTLDAMAVDTFVPGHGDPFGKDHLSKIKGFLMDLVEQVDLAKHQDRSLEQALEGIKLAEWRRELAPDAAAQRFFDGVLADAIRAAWNEKEE